MSICKKEYQEKEPADQWDSTRGACSEQNVYKLVGGWVGGWAGGGQGAGGSASMMFQEVHTCRHT